MRNIAHNEQLLIFQHHFLLFGKNFSHFDQMSTNSFSMEESKIYRLGKVKAGDY